jgi:RNA polymerase sigma-70 factor, ECF subfamily
VEGFAPGERRLRGRQDCLPTKKMTSDEALMIEFQRGSREAFEELFARYRDPLYGFFRRRLQGGPRADDLTQEVFLAVMRAISRYEPRALVRTYLYGIALKLLSAERRRHRDAEANTEPSPAGRPDEALWVREALDRLDTNDREILMLREYEQLSYGEIAEQHRALAPVPLADGAEELFGTGGAQCLKTVTLSRPKRSWHISMGNLRPAAPPKP